LLLYLLFVTRPGRFGVRGAIDGASAVLLKFSPVWVSCTLTDPRTGEKAVKSEFLSVYVWEAGLADAEARVAVEVRAAGTGASSGTDEARIGASVEAGTVEAGIRGSSGTLDAGIVSSPRGKKRAFPGAVAVPISPVKHGYSQMRSAIIGKPGLAKLRLIIDPHRNQLYMIFDEQELVEDGD
jgi:hypothetical protein